MESQDDTDEEFRHLLEKNIKKLLQERRSPNSSNSFYEKEGIKNGISTIRLSIDTKNRLKRYLKPRETYEELILRLIETNLLPKSTSIF